MKASTEQLIEVFNAAKGRRAGPERDKYLAEVCRDDPELQAQVLSLLQAHSDAGDFLEQMLILKDQSDSGDSPAAKK